MSELFIGMGLFGLTVAFVVLCLSCARHLHAEARESKERIDYTLAYMFYYLAALSLIIAGGMIAAAAERWYA